MKERYYYGKLHSFESMKDTRRYFYGRFATYKEV